jgi:AraC-like DNA-binding protein
VNELTHIKTTHLNKLRTEVEQKTSYTLDKCQLNIFETHKKVENIRLTFEGFTITSMLKGKKVLHEDSESSLNYLPGQSYILSADTEMVIDFPEANHSNPTQCTALVIENSYLNKQIEYLNDLHPREKELQQNWDINLQALFLQNDENIVNISNRLIRIFTSNDPLKDILVDLRLKELMLVILQKQNLTQLSAQDIKGNERFRAVIEYIRKNVNSNISPIELSRMACMSKSVFYRTFTSEFGISPGRMILNEKIAHAKKMMQEDNIRIKEVCFALGFSDPNYFSRAFRKVEGIAPVEYLASVRKSN